MSEEEKHNQLSEDATIKIASDANLTEAPDVSLSTGPEPIAEGEVDAASLVEQLTLKLDTFEGPLDLLLSLARGQKVDLAKISILELVEQYLEFMQEARRMQLELAADYLVMAAWLAYLKSRLLLPNTDNAEEPSAEELATRLQLRLQRLEALRDAGSMLMARNQVGRDFFLRGSPEHLSVSKNPIYDVTLYELMKAYAAVSTREQLTELKIERRPIYSLEDALARLNELMDDCFQWETLQNFLPNKIKADKQLRKSALASMFAASLELAKHGKAEVRQMENFGPIYLRTLSNEHDQ